MNMFMYRGSKKYTTMKLTKKILSDNFGLIGLENMCVAQIPYFAKTVDQDRMYAYTSMKVRPGINSQETYTTFQYGLSNSLATGLDLYTSNGNSYWGILMRYGACLSKYFNVGVQVTPSFNLSDNFKFAYLTSALYLNGNITKDGNTLWCANTWWWELMMERPI